MSTLAATNAIKKFRIHEFQGLSKHILRFGPLKPPSAKGATRLPEPDTNAQILLPNPFIPRKNPKTGRWIEPKYSLRRQAELVKKAKVAGVLHLLPPSLKLPVSTLGSLNDAVSNLKISAGKETSAAVADDVHGTNTSGAENAGDISTTPVTTSKPSKTASARAAQELLWRQHVSWEGSPRFKDVPGAELGTKLYAAKKRMFKGHKWERVLPQVERRREILLRDMAKRVASYKNFYKKRKPHPLKPPRSAKAAKLPF